MAPVLPWVCIAFAVFGSTLGRANTELGQSQAAPCEILNTTESGPDLHEVKTLQKKSFSFFVKPESSFKKLVIKLSLRNSFFDSGNFYSDEVIELNTKALTHSGSSQWTHVKVEHYKHRRRGLRRDRHAFRVSFANITLPCITRDTWLIKGFKGFTMFAEGDAKVLFNCVPKDDNKAPVAAYVAYSMWLMAGLMAVASFLLGVLCFVYVYLKYGRNNKRTPVSPIKYPVFDEFDEEVLERFREKVEALRRGKSVAKQDTVVVSYPQRQENFYVLGETRYGGVEGISPEDHHYEEIEKNHMHLHASDSVYHNLSDDGGRNLSTVDNIYATLSFENYLEKRRDKATVSSS